MTTVELLRAEVARCVIDENAAALKLRRARRAFDAEPTSTNRKICHLAQQQYQRAATLKSRANNKLNRQIKFNKETF